jgi:hypothetical protein
MSYCRRCKETFPDNLTACPNCGDDFEDIETESELDDDLDEREGGWVMVGLIGDVISAGYAKETLISYNIPTVVRSESGFFGQAGLNLPQAYGKQKGLFQIHVPAEMTEEAEDILNMILGDNWEKAPEE